jgi:hypothetical protein
MYFVPAVWVFAAVMYTTVTRKFVGVFIAAFSCAAYLSTPKGRVDDDQIISS